MLVLIPQSWETFVRDHRRCQCISGGVVFQRQDQHQMTFSNVVPPSWTAGGLRGSTLDGG